MDFLGEGLRRAVALLLAGDGEVYGIALLTLKIGLIATVLACGLGIPVGFVLATHRFGGAAPRSPSSTPPSRFPPWWWGCCSTACSRAAARSAVSNGSTPGRRSW